MTSRNCSGNFHMFIVWKMEVACTSFLKLSEARSYENSSYFNDISRQPISSLAGITRKHYTVAGITAYNCMLQKIPEHHLTNNGHLLGPLQAQNLKRILSSAFLTRSKIAVMLLFFIFLFHILLPNSPPPHSRTPR